MTWYTASIIISCRLKSGQLVTPIPVYENHTLIQAEDRFEAKSKAESYAKEYVSIDDSLQLNGEPAYWKFEGIRKIVELRHYLDDELDVSEIKDGTELTNSYYEVNDEATVEKLSGNENVLVEYIALD